MTRLCQALVASFALALLSITLLGGGQARAGDDALSPAQTRQVEELIGKYLKDHPEVVERAIQTLQERDQASAAEHQAAAIKANADALFHDAADLSVGNPKGDVTIVEFFDYRCPYCKRMAPTLLKTIENDGHTRLVLKEFPILGRASQEASAAALASRKQGKYAAFHDALLASATPLDHQTILDIAAKVGLDTARLAQDMKDPAIAALIGRNYKLADALKIDGTPAFIIGDKLIPGAIDAATLEQLIREQRRKS